MEKDVVISVHTRLVGVILWNVGSGMAFMV